MQFALTDSLREKVDLQRPAASEKKVAIHQKISLLIVLAIGLLGGCETRQNQPPRQTNSRQKADEVFGKAAVEAASAGNYDAADDFLNYVESDAICDDYSETASLQLLTLGKGDAATAIAYKIEGVSHRDRLLKQIESEMPRNAEVATTDTEIHESNTTTEPTGR